VPAFPVDYGPLDGPGGLPGRVDPDRTVVMADAFTRRYAPSAFPPSRIVDLPRGEAAKDLSVLESVYGALLAAGVGRDWTVLGLGGGTVCDVAGFAASTWMRGIDFGYAPTTLLAMVDAAVGGKNALNFGGFKNLLGTFAQPRFTLVDTATLASLPDRDLACGLAEAAKHGVLDGPDHFASLERACGSASRPAPASLESIVRASVRYKTGVAAADPRETGPRMRLNLGHTIGHAVEAAGGLPHGECVAVGLAAAFRLSAANGGSSEDAARVTDFLRARGLPVTIGEAMARAAEIPPGGTPSDPDTFRAAVAEALKADKKRRGDDIVFVMPRAIGRVDLVPVPLEKLARFVRNMP